MPTSFHMGIVVTALSHFVRIASFKPDTVPHRYALFNFYHSEHHTSLDGALIGHSLRSYQLTTFRRAQPIWHMHLDVGRLRIEAKTANSSQLLSLYCLPNTHIPAAVVNLGLSGY